MRVDDERYRRLIEAMLEGFAYCRMVFDADGSPSDFEYLAVNDAFGRLTGLDDVEGKLVSEVIPGLRDTNPELFEIYGRVASTGQPAEIDAEVEALGLRLHLLVYQPEPGCFAALFADVTQRSAAEQELRDSEERFEALFNRAPLGYQSLDSEGRLIEVNDMWLETLGYHRDEVIGAWFGDFLAPEFVDAFRERFPLFKSLGAIHSEFEMLHRDGGRRSIAFEGRVGHNADGSFRQTHCILTDITERAQAEAALRESEEKFKYLFEHSVVPKSITMPDGQVNVNDAFCEMLGYSRAEIADRSTWQQLSHPDDVADTAAIMASLVAGETSSARFEKRYLCKDGSVVWADVSSSLRRDDKGEPEYFMTTMIDITDRNRALGELVASEERLRRAVQDAPVPIMIHAEDGEVMQISREWERVTGYSLDVIPTTADWTERAYGSRAELVRDDIEALYGLDAPKDEGEYVVRAADGSERVWYFRSAPLGTSADGRRTVMSTALDVTERRQAENEILRLNSELERRVQDRTEELEATNEELLAVNVHLGEVNAKLEEATRAKNDFLASMSHELRTPLNSIIGFSGILKQELAGPLNEEQAKQVGMINNSGRHLLELVNEVLDLAKVESTHSKPVLYEVDLRTVAREMFDTVRPMADTKGIEMRWSCPADLRPVWSDGLRVGQIVLNLVGNAIKFTDRGYVAVNISQELSDTRVSIEDTGCGIAEEDLDRIFEDFYQVQPHSSARSQGTGLGLAVCRRLAESIGADIGVASELGQGSVFMLSVPEARP